MGIASIVIGILSICLSGVPFINIILAILGLILGIVCWNKTKDALLSVSNQIIRVPVQKTSEIQQPVVENQTQIIDDTNAKKTTSAIGIVINTIALIISIVTIITVFTQ